MDLRSINASGFDGAPEWKTKVESEALNYGIISNKSIKEQREGLSIAILKGELIGAIQNNQVLVVIGEHLLKNNYILVRGLDLMCIIRMWDTYLAQDSSNGFDDFHIYVCASLLHRFSKDLKRRQDFEELFSFLN